MPRSRLVPNLRLRLATAVKEKEDAVDLCTTLRTTVHIMQTENHELREVNRRILDSSTKTETELIDLRQKNHSLHAHIRDTTTKSERSQKIVETMQEDRRNLQKDIALLKVKSEVDDRNLRGVQADNRSLQGHLKALEEKSAEDDAETERLRREGQQLSAAIERATDLGAVQDLELYRLRLENENLRAEAKNAMARVRIYEAERRLQAEAMHKAQQTVFKLTSQGPWIPDEDSTTIRRFQKVQKSVRDWSDRYHASSGLAAVLNGTDGMRLRHHLNEVCGVGTDLLSSSVPDAVAKKAVSLVLNAFLNHVICRHLFSNPFFIFRGSDEQPSMFESASELSRVLMQQATQYDPVGANEWRAKTLRLLHPQMLADTNAGQDLGTIKTLTETRRSQVCSQMSTDVLSEVLQPLIKDAENSAMHDKLASIFREAGELAYSLGTQTRRFLCYGADELPSTFEKEWMEAHPLHNALLSEDDAALDGFPLLLLLSPAFVVRGSVDGCDYSGLTILRKAVVLVDVSFVASKRMRSKGSGKSMVPYCKPG